MAWGRFVGVYELAGSAELDLYLELSLAFEPLNPGTASESRGNYSEAIFVSFPAAMELFKSRFAEYIPTKIYESYQERITALTINGIQPRIDLDDFLLHVISMTEEYKNEKFNFFQVLFDSIDLDKDGFLNYSDCRILFRHLGDQ
jgi:hypothetical protein